MCDLEAEVLLLVDAIEFPEIALLEPSGITVRDIDPPSAEP